MSVLEDDCDEWSEIALDEELTSKIFDLKNRYKDVVCLRDFLLSIKDDVKMRRDLRRHLEYRLDRSNDRIRTLLRTHGWLSLDPWYGNDEEWGNATLIINDRTIREALTAFKVPKNREWCDCLVQTK